VLWPKVGLGGGGGTCQADQPAMVARLPSVDALYAAPQAHRIVNIALHQEYSLGMVFIFSHGRKYLYHV
jgi:hypothetical protein